MGLFVVVVCCVRARYDPVELVHISVVGYYDSVFVVVLS